MVAATFPNLSFENPPGTGPTLVNSSAELYPLNDGDILNIVFAGETLNVVFLASDFANIALATAAEVAAVFEAQVDDLGAADDAGFVRLTSLLTGEDVGLEIVGGAANDALNFPLVAINGETYAGGAPNGWTTSTDIDNVTEWAEWADENGRPEEIFDGDGWIAFALSGALNDAIFDLAFIPSPFETFENWSTYGFLTTFVGEQATFNVNTELNDGFEIGWGTPNVFVLGAVDAGSGVNPDDFETGWGNGSVAPVSDDAIFATIQAFENFVGDGVLNWAFVIQILSGADGLWAALVNGVAFTFESSSDTPAQIATALAAAVDGGLANVQAVSVGDNIYVGPDPGNAGVDFVVTATGPAVSVVEAVVFPAFVNNWIAQDRTPDFD